MIRTQFVAHQSFVRRLAALVLVAGAAVSSAATANALPHFGLHAHPADSNDTRVVLDLYNKGNMFRDVKVNGKIYTILPNQSLTIKAPQGTPVFINSTGALHHKGDLLFSVDPSMKNKVLFIN